MLPRETYSLFGAHDASSFLHVHDVRDHPARLLLLSEVSILQPHDGIRGKGRSHLSRAVVSAPHEFPRSHPIPSSSRDASSSMEEVESVVVFLCD